MKNIERRSFLKGSALLAASAFLMPRTLAAQDPQNANHGQAGQAGQVGRAGQEKDGQAGQEKDGQTGQGGQAGQAGQDKEGQAGQAGNNPPAKEGDGAETFVGADGRPYRVCPQCGANMYKQNRTWTCENCGYSYEE
jgi:rubredoxin